MYLDLILSVLIVWGMFRGFKRGLIIELCTLMALILGVFGAAYFGVELSEYLKSDFNTDPRISLVLSFAILFLGIVIGVFFFGKVLEGLIKLVALGLFNKLFGMLFGGVKFALILSGLLYILNGFPFSENLIPQEWKKESYLYQPVSEIAIKIYPALKRGNWIENLENKFENLKEDILE